MNILFVDKHACPLNKRISSASHLSVKSEEKKKKKTFNSQLMNLLWRVKLYQTEINQVILYEPNYNGTKFTIGT